MAIEATFRAETAAELIDQVRAFVGVIVGGAVAKPEAAESPTSTEKPATRGRGKKAEEAADLRRAVGTTATVVEAPETETEEAVEDDPLGEAADETLDPPTVTADDVRALLVKVKNAFPKKPTLISDIVKNVGGAAKLADVPEEKFALIAAEANKHLASVK